MAQPATFRPSVIEGDLTKVEADAIVNAANCGLLAGGGVCGAIFKAAGADVLTAACHAIGNCPTGSGVITPAFDIKSAKHIIHAVEPIYAHYDPAEARRLLASAYAASIRLAATHGCASLAFPAISTGIYGYPLEEACRTGVEVRRTEGPAAGLEIKLVAFARCRDGELPAPSRRWAGLACSMITARERARRRRACRGCSRL
jgi:O-acetyl-ADP-ribose deacetylase (regulator of RNase III)